MDSPAPAPSRLTDRNPDADEVLTRMERLIAVVCVQATAHGHIASLAYPAVSAVQLSSAGVLQRHTGGEMRHTATPQRLADLLALLLSSYSILTSRQQRTLRDVYYDNVHQGIFASQERVNAASQLLSDIINVPRWRLGLVRRWQRRGCRLASAFFILSIMPRFHLQFFHAIFHRYRHRSARRAALFSATCKSRAIAAQRARPLCLSTAARLPHRLRKTGSTSF